MDEDAGYWCSEDHSQGRLISARVHWHPAPRVRDTNPLPSPEQTQR
jgi:hypothetical protein